MKTTLYTGVFVSDTGHSYTLQTSANSFIQALFLLTADAIRAGKHYQLHNISDEYGRKYLIGDIMKVTELFQ